MEINLDEEYQKLWESLPDQMNGDISSRSFFKAGAELMRKLLTDTVLKQDEGLKNLINWSQLMVDVNVLNEISPCEFTDARETRQQTSAVVEYLRGEGDK